MDSLPEPNVRLEAEIKASKSTVADLKDQLDTVKSALAEAKERLAERAENQRTVNAAKATAAQLAVSEMLLLLLLLLFVVAEMLRDFYTFFF